MTQIRRGMNWIGRGLVAGVMMAAAWSAQAASTWNFGSNNDPTTECIPSEVTASGGCKSSSGDVLYMKGTGYTSASGSFQSTSIQAWDGSGLGVGGEGNPEHSVDNANGVELIALDFKGSSVALKSISFGWTYNSEADFSIFRWVGAASGPAAGDITGKTTSNLKNDASGWQLVGNWAGDTAGGYSLGISDSTASSWWLVSAYSGSYGGSCNTTHATSCGDGNDYFKLLTVTANLKPGGGGSAPEPGSLALMGMALAGVLAVQRRREQPTPKG